MEDDEEHFVKCEICNLLFTDVEPYNEHIRGSKHKKEEKKRKNKEMQNAKEKSPEGENESSGTTSHDDSTHHSDTDEEITCTVCDKTFSGVIPYTQHIKSGPHSKELRRQKLTEKLKQNISEQAKDVDITSENEKPSVLPQAFATCKVCYKEFSGPESFQKHLVSKSHKRKVTEEKILENLMKNEKLDSLLSQIKARKGKEQSVARVDSSESYEERIAHELETKIVEAEEPDEESVAEPHFKCEECEKSFSGIVPFMQHLISPTHKKKLKQIKLLKIVESAKEESEKHGQNSETSDEEANDILTCDMCKMAFSGPESMLAHMKSRGHLKMQEMKKLRDSLKAKKKGSEYSKKVTVTPANDVQDHAKKDESNVAGSSNKSRAVTVERNEYATGTCLSEDFSEMVNQETTKCEEKPQTANMVQALDPEKCTSENPSIENKSVQTDGKQSGLQKFTKALKVAIEEL